MVRVLVQSAKVPYQNKVYTLATSENFKAVVRGPPTALFQQLCSIIDCTEEVEFILTKATYRLIDKRKMKFVQAQFPNINIKVDEKLYEIGWGNMKKQRVVIEAERENEFFKIVWKS